MVNYKYFFLFSLVVIVLKIALNTTGHRISTYFAYIVILLAVSSVMKSKVYDVNVSRRQCRLSMSSTLLLRFVTTMNQLKCADVHLCAVVAI